AGNAAEVLCDDVEGITERGKERVKDRHAGHASHRSAPGGWWHLLFPRHRHQYPARIGTRPAVDSKARPVAGQVSLDADDRPPRDAMVGGERGGRLRERLHGPDAQLEP